MENEPKCVCPWCGKVQLQKTRTVKRGVMTKVEKVPCGSERCARCNNRMLQFKTDIKDIYEEF